MPHQLPIAVVDQDLTSTTRQLKRQLQAYASTNIVASYANISDARVAMQKGEIYGYLLIPEGFTGKLLSSRQPFMSLYYNGAIFTGGVLAYKDMKIISMMAKKAVGVEATRAIGLTDSQAEAILQPVRIDAHMTGNPWSNYNIYITTMIVPGVIILLLTVLLCYSVPDIKKMLTDSLLVALCLFAFQIYLYVYMQMPHGGSWWVVMLLSCLMITAAMGFALFVFALIPSRRLSMSVCSLWGVVSFSICGAAYPVDSMHPLLQALSYLFPLRHYLMAYQMSVLHGFPLHYAYQWFAGLVVFSALPLLVIRKLHRQIREFVYVE
ncbi:MAG: ABC transporter permease [Bacteroidaceae bacterium]|nr:ABC transporter permease [Bacteroidaceae bacterium]